MKNFNAILFLFTGVLYLSFCEAKCRGKNATKLKRSLKLAISSDNINNRHKAGLRKIFRRKRDTNDEEIESDIFTAEIKFLQKWNPAMSQKDGSAYRLLQGNVLDSILEQMNADRRFINSRVLDLKQTSNGILAKVGFHFRKSEHNPISHIRFVVSRGHVSSLKVDKNYFKILKTPASLFKEHEDSKAPTQHQQTTKTENNPKNNPSVAQQESNPNPATKQTQNETPPSVSGQNQDQPKNMPSDIYQTQNQPSILTGNPNQPQNEAKPAASSQNQGSAQRQGNQQKLQNAQDNKQPPQSNDQGTSQVQKQQQPQAEDKVQNQNKDNAQAVDNQSTSPQPQTAYQTEATNTEQQTYPQDQKPAAFQPEAQSTSQLTQNTPNPPATVDAAQNQNGQSHDGKLNEPISPKPVETTSPQVQGNQGNQESSSFTKDSGEEDISIKMNQAWFPFLSNHDTPQYKMLAGNLEKGLKSVMEADKNIKDIKVKDLLQADEGHTTVEFLIQFNAGQKGSTEKLRNIVKTGDIAGISVDADFFEIKDHKKPLSENPQS